MVSTCCNLIKSLAGGSAIICFTQCTDPILLAIHFPIAAIQTLWGVCLVGVKCPYHLGKHDMVWDSHLMVVARGGGSTQTLGGNWGVLSGMITRSTPP